MTTRQREKKKSYPYHCLASITGSMFFEKTTKQRNVKWGRWWWSQWRPHPFKMISYLLYSMNGWLAGYFKPFAIDSLLPKMCFKFGLKSKFWWWKNATNVYRCTLLCLRLLPYALLKLVFFARFQCKWSRWSEKNERKMFCKTRFSYETCDFIRAKSQACALL